MQDNNKHNINFDLIARYLAGEASEDEHRSLEQWLSSSEAHKKNFEEYRKMWDMLGKHKPDKKINIDEEWHKLNNKITVSPKEKPRVVKMFKPLLRAAAIFLVLAGLSAGVFYLIRQQQFATYATATDIKQVSLADGSLVTLNSNTIIKVHPDYTEKSRTVQLEGDAFFDVKPDKTKPFIVKTGNIIVQVTGTSFYIHTSQDKDKTEVIVKSGTVSVFKKGDKKKKFNLQAGEKVYFDRENTTLIKQKNNDINYLSWKTKTMEFNAQPLDEIVSTLNNVYKKNITIKSDAIRDCKVTVTFEKQPLNAVLEVLKHTLDLEIQQQNKQIILSGDGC